MKARLYLADARSMQELENESVQLIITSPPYWHIIRRDRSKNTNPLKSL
jgi:DNA modification methylase